MKPMTFPVNDPHLSLWKPDAFAGHIGVAQVDITPPATIFARNWGAAKHDAAEGVHRPLLLTCITFQAGPEAEPLIIISADFGVWRNAADGRVLREKILQALSLAPSRLMFCLTHTHSGPVLSSECVDRSGGEYITTYLDELVQKLLSVVGKALESATSAVLTWQYGSCSLATDRDLPEPEKYRYLVGFNPATPADATLLVGRITDTDDRITGVLVNYACHPTTLGWENRLISPDYVGAMRELVQSTTGAPCLFLQGASGELAPAEQYTADVEVADKHGRQLGYCVLATLESMLPPGTGLSFTGVVESGAPLGVWRRKAFALSTLIEAQQIIIDYEVHNLPSLKEIEQQYHSCEDRVLKERLWRKRATRLNLGEGTSVSVPLWIWRLGDALLLGQPNEAYSAYQKELRSHFSPQSIAVMNLVNGSAGYLPPQDLYDKDLYQVWQTPFAAGSLEKLIHLSIAGCAQMNSKY
jgi:hypothetical protein